MWRFYSNGRNIHITGNKNNHYHPNNFEYYVSTSVSRSDHLFGQQVLMKVSRSLRNNLTSIITPLDCCSKNLLQCIDIVYCALSNPSPFAAHPLWLVQIIKQRRREEGLPMCKLTMNKKTKQLSHHYVIVLWRTVATASPCLVINWILPAALYFNTCGSVLCLSLCKWYNFRQKKKPDGTAGPPSKTYVTIVTGREKWDLPSLFKIITLCKVLTIVFGDNKGK